MFIVCMTKEITPESLVQIYYTLGISLLGSVAVKIFTGEPGNRNFLQPELIRDLVQELKSTIVECNAACEGKRNASKDHWETMRDHGLTAITSCDILGEEDHMPFPVTGDFHLTENYVGPHLQSCDPILILSHSKGHATGGFGGASKNIFVGLTSSYGGVRIRSSGISTRFEDVFTADHDPFLESMVDADRSIMDHMGRENIVYIDMANHLSMSCDCDAHPHDPEMGGIGISASTNPVTLDQACMDAICASEDGGKTALIE